MGCDNLFVMKGTRCGLTAHWASRTSVIREGGLHDTAYIHGQSRHNKLAFGRTQDVGTVSVLRPSRVVEGSAKW